MKIGRSGSTFGAYFQFGDVGTISHVAYFGKRFGTVPPAYQISLFQTFATTVLIEAANFLTMRSVFQLDFIAETGSMGFTASMGGMTFSSAQGISLTQTSLSQTILIASAGFVNVTGNSILDQTNNYALQGSISNWIATNPVNSSQCIGAAGPPPNDNTRVSLAFGQDLILNGASPRILANTTQGVLTIGPDLQICGMRIRSVSNTLILQGNTTTDAIYFDVLFMSTNNATTRFNNPLGFDLFNTPLVNQGNADLSGCGVPGLTMLNNTIVVGNFSVIGNIRATGTIVGSATIGTCFSDSRVKKDVIDVEPSDALQRILRLPVKAFKYKDEFVHEMEGTLKRGVTYVGSMAHDLEKDFGYAVRRMKQKVGDTLIHDMAQVDPHLLYGEIVAGIQGLHSIHKRTVQKLYELEQNTVASTKSMWKRLNKRLKRLERRANLRL